MEGHQGTLTRTESSLDCHITVHLPLNCYDQFNLAHNPDVLNRLNPAYFKKPRLDPATYSDPDPTEQLRKARHLCHYIFPLQCGLPNVFSFMGNKNETYRQPNFTDRENEIKVCFEFFIIKKRQLC